ncbi:MAG: VCBS domain-containing protein, partial [Mariniblastus sp.]
MPETPSNSNGPEKRNLLIEQLEERALFDAVPIAPIDAQSIEVDAGAYLETMVNAISADAEAGANQQEQVAKKEVLFVDKSVEGFGSVVAEFVEGRDVDVFFINDQSSGFEQIAKHLEGRNDIEAIHIVSHGSDARLSLGSSIVGQEELAGQYTSELVRIGQSLSESGDILIYGCDLASSSAGEAFISELSQITNADVAASDDITGAAAVGGDWILEKSTGSIETQSLSSSSFSGQLLVTDAGFTIGTGANIGNGEVAIVPEGEPGTSSYTYANAATANSGAITVDVRLTLVDTYDELGNLTTGQSNQLPVTFGNWSNSPVLLSRIVGSSVGGYEGHTAEIRVDFFDQATGNPLSIVGDFTFHDIDFEPATANGSGAEQVQIFSDEMLGYQISNSPTSEIVVQEEDGRTNFTNATGAGSPNDEQRWVSIQFKDTVSHSLIFQSRNGNTGYGLTTKNFFNTPLSFTPPVATDDDFATDQDTSLAGNVVSTDNGSGVDSDPDSDPLTVSNVNGLTANVGTATAGSNGGLFTINANGSYSFDPNGEFDYLPAGQTATTTITYQIGDGTGLTDEATVTVIVSGLDDAPINVGTIPPLTNYELETVFVDLAGSFDAVDDGETLVFSSGTTLPPGLSINPNTGVVSGLPNSNTDGVYTVSIVATDSDGESTTQTFDWTILPPVPVAFDNYAAVNKNGTTSDNGNLITDDDGFGADFDTDGDTLVVTEINGSAANVGTGVVGTYGTLVANSDGTYTYTLDTANAAVLALTPGNTLNESFTYTVGDLTDGSATATLNITINAGASWTLTGDSSVDEGNIANYVLSLQDGVEPGETVSVDIGLADVDTTSADYANFVAAVNNAIAGEPSLSFDGTTLTYANPYVVTSSALGGAFDDISGTGTAIASGDDDSDQINIGFNYDFFGSSYNQLFIGSNGFVTFGGAATEFNNQDFSAAQTIGNRPAIAAFWDDLDPTNAASGGIFYEVQGTPGDQELIIQWNQIVPYNGGAGDEITFQIVLSESTAEFEIRYLETGAGANAEGASATIGVSDGGANFTQYSFNTANAVQNNTILSFGSQSLTPIEIDLTSVQDSLSEVDEKYRVTISNATNGTSIGSDFTVTTEIVDDDNLAPNATDNVGSVTEDTALSDSGNVISDDDGSGVDSDPEGDFFYVTAVDGGSANVGVTLNGTYGDIVLNSDGSYTYNLDNGNAAVNALDNGETLSESFTYTITDIKGESSTATLTINIDGTNDAPLTGGTIPPQVDVDSETISTVDVTSVFSDPDGDTLTYTATGLPAGLVLNQNSGLITGQIDNSASQGGPASDGVYSVAVTATDDNGATVTSTFSWTVTNPGPTATDNTGAVTENVTATDSGNVISDNDGSGVDSDPDGDSISVTSFDGSSANVGSAVSGTYGSITLNSNGSYTYTLDNNNAAVNALDNGETLSESFAYEISDGEGGTSIANLTITINGTNDAPLAGGTISPQNDLDADSGISVDVTNAFSDPDGDTLTYTATGLPAGLTLNLNTGEITGTIDNSASQGGPASNGIYSVEVTATDDNGATVTTTFAWTVTNPGPTATDNTANVTEDGTLTDSGNVISDNDGSGVDSDPDADDLTIAAVDGLAGNVGVAVKGSYGSIVVNGDGTYTYTLDNNNSAVNALDNGETLSETFSYTVSDDEGGTSTADLIVTINGTNDAPTVGGTISPQNDLDAETGISVDVTTAFSDPDGDTLTYPATGLPAGLTLNLNTGEITGTIDNSASQGGPASDGIYSVEVTATDDNG